MAKIFALITLLFVSSLSYADDAPLSYSTYPLYPPTIDDSQVYLANTKSTDLSKNDLMAVLQFQTKVKTQGSRNTCTVFSIVALLESLLLTQNPSLKAVDLSEQWLQYLVALRSPTGGANGSTVPINFAQIQKYGIADENVLKYDGTVWTAKTPQAAKTCANLSDLSLTRCLTSHLNPHLLGTSDADLSNTKNPLYNPNFIKARTSANKNKVGFANVMDGYIMGTTSTIKKRLRDGLPLTLEINVFYGAWNHSNGNSIGIDTDSNLFTKGIVTYPDKKSVDHTQSPTQLARHAVLIVGYDDNVEVTYTKNMNDGSTATFKRKGVYYFKNSWGTSKFGSQFKVLGKKVPGFGIILQDYANEYGQFYAIDLAPGVSI